MTDDLTARLRRVAQKLVDGEIEIDDAVKLIIAICEDEMERVKL